ncbi:MAG TPA: NADPH-dependent FMN reductase [Trebonia sp.]|jgi:azobenzene reductase|nr:NADPH-dependent FMN reductase [Trebonia sp.]
MKALVLSGSVSPRSRTRAVALAARGQLRGLGVDCEMWDLRESPLPIADPAYHEDPALHPDPEVRRFVAAADEADSFVIVSPVYHNSFSGVLKNSLDMLTIPQLAYKPVGLGAFGGSLAAVQVCDQLRTVTRGLHGIALPVQVVATPADFEADHGGEPILTNPELLDRFGMLARDLVLFAHLRKVTVIGR